MTPRTSTRSFGRLASAAALAAVMLVGDGATGRHRQADACGWSGPETTDLTTFDPSVVAELAQSGLQYDPFVAGFGGPCDDCARTAMLADWQAYFGGANLGPDWDKVLFEASAAQLADLRAAVASGRGTAKAFAAIARAAAA